MTANLPAVQESAPLPTKYEAARKALAECYRVDECKEWADRALAMKSYARQANDKGLADVAARIQGRAVRRMGELQREADGRGGDRRSDSFKSKGSLTSDSPRPQSGKRLADEAGLSLHQQRQASRVARIPEAEFEEAIEAPDPPSVTELADMGRKSLKAKPKLRPLHRQQLAAWSDALSRPPSYYAEDPVAVVEAMGDIDKAALAAAAATMADWWSAVAVVARGDHE